MRININGGKGNEKSDTHFNGIPANDCNSWNHCAVFIPQDL